MHAGRIPALDGLRGVLALWIVFHHVAMYLWQGGLGFVAAQVVVCTFFALSGLVLSRSYDGRLGAFILRRVIRLWPLFAVCMLAGYAIEQRQPNLSHLLFWPPFQEWQNGPVVAPAWSLFIEAWASPFIPLVAWSSRSTWRSLLLATGAACTASVWPQVGYLVLFILGGWLGRFRWESPMLESAPAQWLGQVSYSLYLTHWLVLMAVMRIVGHSLGGVAALPLMFGVAQLAWALIEKPSIDLSRRVADLKFLGAGKDTLPA